jgi:hypothetical protein
VELLADRFLNTKDGERYRQDLAEFLKDPRFCERAQPQDLNTFLHGLREGTPAERRNCGNRLWTFYTKYLEITPQLAAETEAVLEHLVRTLVADGYAGVLLMLDEVSLFLNGRTPEQRDDDEKTLVVLANRVAKHAGLPLWTICSAHQSPASPLGQQSVIAADRLKFAGLVSDPRHYDDIVLQRVRRLTDAAAVGAYFEEYRRGFTWPAAAGPVKFAQYFPFYPPAIDVLRELSHHLTTARSSIHFLHRTLRGQCQAKSPELISLWQLFDDVVTYTDGPTGTTAGISEIAAKFSGPWRAYEVARRAIGQATRGHLKVYASRCEKILKTLFLYHVAQLDGDGVSVEQIMNCVMEWKDHKTQTADATDNLDHYEALCQRLAQELPQVRRVGQRYRFNPLGGGVDVRALFDLARAAAASDAAQQRRAWEALLALESWELRTPRLRTDLACGTVSIFHRIAPAEQTTCQLPWHGRLIKGIVYMRNLAEAASQQADWPPIDSADTGHDFAVFISDRPCGDRVAELAAGSQEPRALYWSPAELTPTEHERLLDLAAYRQLVHDYENKDTAEADAVLTWIADRLPSEIGTIYKMVPDSYARGRIGTSGQGDLPCAGVGDLAAILAPLVGQVLDAVYASARLQFSGPVAFSDSEALKVLTGIVCPGEIAKGTKPNQYTAAAENYGYALGIMKKRGKKQLDPSGCEFVADIERWLQAQFDLGNTPTVASVYKNFTGTGGPYGKHYGLSRRMVDIYLLSLVRLGQIRIALAGKAASAVPHLDDANLAEVQVTAALLDGMDQIQRVQAPAEWTLKLADFRPSRPTIGRADIETIVAEFRQFLESSFPADGPQQSVTVKLH